MSDPRDDMFVPVWEGPFVEAERLMRRLESAHIPVDLGEALEAGRARVEVPPGYVEEALDVMSSPDPVEHLSMPMIGSPSPGWTAFRVAVVLLVVVVLVLALVL